MSLLPERLLEVGETVTGAFMFTTFPVDLLIIGFNATGDEIIIGGLTCAAGCAGKEFLFCCCPKAECDASGSIFAIFVGGVLSCVCVSPKVLS